MKEDIYNLKLAIGRKLKVFRHARSLTQNELAEAINEKMGTSYSGNAVSAWEMGKNSMSIELLVVISSILKVDIRSFDTESSLKDGDPFNLLDHYENLTPKERENVQAYIHFLLWKRNRDKDTYHS